METGIVKIPSYADPAHTGYIDKLKQSLADHVLLEGKHHGEQNKPNTEPELRALILNYIQTHIQDGIEKTQQVFLPFSGMVVAKQIRDRAQEQVTVLLNERRDAAHVLRALQNEAENLKPELKPSRLRFWAMTGLGLIAVTDGMLSYGGFRFASFPVVASVAASAGVAVGIGLGAHFLGGYIRRAKTATQARVRYIISLVPYALGFYWLAVMRASAYNHAPLYITGSTVPHQLDEVSAWSIAIVSFLLFWIALFISTRFYKTKEEVKREQDYMDKCVEVQQVQDRIAEIDAIIERIQTAAATEAGLALAKYEFALSCECGLRTYAKHMAEQYKSKNLRHRTDGICPEFFSVIPEFQFTTFFNNSNPQNRENN